MKKEEIIILIEERVNMLRSEIFMLTGNNKEDLNTLELRVIELENKVRILEAEMEELKSANGIE